MYKYMERDFNINRDFFTLETYGGSFFSDLTKKLVSSAGEKVAPAVGSKAGEALGNKLFGVKSKTKASNEQKQPIINENMGDELIKLLQQSSARSVQSEHKKQSTSNIHEIHNRLLEDK